MTTTSSRKYHTLLTRDDANSPWAITFGDYDRECVEYDADTYEYDGVPTHIITTSDAQADIDAAVARLNN